VTLKLSCKRIGLAIHICVCVCVCVCVCCVQTNFIHTFDIYQIKLEPSFSEMHSYFQSMGYRKESENFSSTLDQNFLAFSNGNLSDHQNNLSSIRTSLIMTKLSTYLLLQFLEILLRLDCHTQTRILLSLISFSSDLHFIFDFKSVVC
jgi:hypothetical protein